jgi:hypothetical protein
MPVIARIATIVIGINFMKWLTTALLPLLLSCTEAPSQSPIAPTPLPAIQYQQKHLDRAIAHIVIIPADRRYQIKPVLSASLQSVDQLTQTTGGIAGINAGFFDPSNQQTTSYVVIDGKTVANPQENSRLVDNPKLQPYLARIFDRSEFRRYDCQGEIKYAIESHSQSSDCQLIDAIGGGPRLLPELNAELEAFFDPKTGRDPIGINQLNARSAIGMTAANETILVMVAQTQPGNGMSLPELAKFMQSLGAVQALNLDGGTSSAIFYQNQLAYGKRNAENKPEGRPIKSAIVVYQK